MRGLTESMFYKPTLSLLQLAFAFLLCNYAKAVTYVDNGTSNPYTLNAGDSLFIATGIYTGNIGGFATGAKITVSDLAIFQPTGMNHPNVHGTMYVYGTFIMNNPNFRTNTDFTLYNYGTVQINNQTTMSGQNQLWFNSFGANMYFVGNVTMNGGVGDNNNVLINYENIECSGNFQMNSGSYFTNNKEFSAAGSFTVNGGTFDNYGQFDITGAINLNNGASIIRNHCRMMSSGGINNTSGNFYNYSYLWARNDLGLGNITVSDTIFNIPVNGAVPMIHGKNLTQTGGAIVGQAYLYFYGTTSITGSAATGVPGVTTDTIKVYDITRASPVTIYDIQTGTVRPNTIYNAWGIPDSTREYAVGCSIEVLLEVPLGINWNSFHVALEDDIPVLTWDAEFGNGTVFEVERSYDGRNFSVVASMNYVVNQSQYVYNDRLVNQNFNLVYYRIKATEPNRPAKYTTVKAVRFGSKQGTLVFPNPFSNILTASYNATENSVITLMLFNTTGQIAFRKVVPVYRGVNTIRINEASQLSPGVYILRISNGAEKISATKLIKR